MPNFALIATPLNRKLEKGQPSNFETLTDTEYVAFEEFKRLLVAPPIMALPKRDVYYKIDTDACDTQVQNNLLQDQGGGEFLDRPSDFSATALDKEDDNRKLQPKTTGPYQLIDADGNTVTIDCDGLQDTVAIDPVTRAPPEPATQLLANLKGQRRVPLP